jgi:serine/threonine protein phosphatase PrpC
MPDQPAGAGPEALDEGRAAPPTVPASEASDADMPPIFTATMEPSPADPVPAPPPTAGNELEELTFPPSNPALDPLPDGTAVGPDGRFVIERLREQQGSVNHYLATVTDEAGQPSEIELLEAPSDQEGLRRQGEVLATVAYAMLPRLHAAWEDDGRRYLAINLLDGPTLADALAAGTSTEEIVSCVLQLAQVLRRLRDAGWVLAGLSPDGVCVGQPIRVTRLESAVHLGERPAHAFQLPGYSAPELAQSGPVTGKEEVYTLAAILYHGLAGEPIPEQGVAMPDLATRIQVSGAPQLLAPALAPVTERIDLDEFYRRLLAFKRRLSVVPLALQVASGSTIGLNETRLTNEDAGGFLSWNSAYEGRVAANVVLCVVDGMGGMEAGEVVSTAALRAVLVRTAAHAADEICRAPGPDRADGSADTQSAAPEYSPSLDPRTLVQAAAEAAYTAGRGRSVGATITCTVIEDGKLTLGHVGDTRAYLLRAGTLTQLTRDHSLVAAMVAGGLLSKEEARHHPESNKVLRSLGGQRILPEEYVDDLAVTRGEATLQLHPDDRLLLCSDGVWGQVEDDDLRQILVEALDSHAAVEAILRWALNAGAPDNATAIVAFCQAMPAV